MHSLKDLSLDRPAALALGAIAASRQPARHRDLRARRARAPQRPARVCASALPRRGAQQLLPAVPGARAALSRAKSHHAGAAARQRRQPPAPPARTARLGAQLDGIVLALAGLSRLFADTMTERQGREAADRAARRAAADGAAADRQCPAAPGQGALAIECRADDARTRVHSCSAGCIPPRARRSPPSALCWPNTAAAATSASAPRSWTCPGSARLLQIAGLAAAGSDISSGAGRPPRLYRPRPTSRTAVGRHPAREPTAAAPLGAPQHWLPQLAGEAVFIAHSRALPADAAPLLPASVSGPPAARAGFGWPSRGLGRGLRRGPRGAAWPQPW